jgi:hypothetical protein
MKYKPRYAKGQILVAFKDVSEGFARDFGEKLGYTLGENSEYNKDMDFFTYDVPENKEKKACNDFKKYSKFVEWTSLRDLRLEERWSNLEEAIRMTESIRDNCEIPKKEFEGKIEKVIGQLKKIKG